MSDNKAPQIIYEVFVSFSGEIRRELFSHLVASLKNEKINAFVDERLQRGHEIWPSLVEAIETSSISLIIFSPDYASSHWCLDELVTILECRNKYGQTIIPVFYKVEPTDVGHQSSKSYIDAFAKHEKEYNETKVQKWRDALKKTAKIGGIVSSKFQNDRELIKGIVNLINSNLKSLPKSAVNSKKLIAIDKKVATVGSLIRKVPEETRVIGIWGMGGIGKTTLAQQVFNKLRFEYNGSCFLSDERKESNNNGIISSKKFIFSRLLGPDVARDIEMLDSLPRHIVDKTRGMKVLIVLDNVDDPQHLGKILGNYLKVFGSGSRIIITTRDEQVLKASKANETYQLQELSFDEALDLFNLNAFDQRDDQREYTDLSKRVVRHVKGIPLVLEVLAFNLLRNPKELWEGELDKLEKRPHKNVYDVMLWSYEGLDPEQQQIFLDLACFFLRSHHTKNNVSDLKLLLKDGESGSSVNSDLQRLKQKALITFSEDNCVSMHDVLQEMALEIVRRKPINDPDSRIRLWDPKDIYDVLKTGKVSEDIRSIQIDFSKIKELKSIPDDIFAKMSRLQFLEISGTYNYCSISPRHILAKGLKDLPSELRFFYWKYYPLKSLPENFSVERFVMLSLQSGAIEKLWDGVKKLVNLKVLDLSWSWRLKKLPDLSIATNLEVLHLNGCCSLTSIDPSIFILPKLEILDLNGTGIKELPSFGQQNNLKSLRLQTSKIEMLPSSFKNFTLVLHLDVSRCYKLHTILELPPSLETLDVSWCETLRTIEKLPHSLKTLNVSFCTSLKTLPELPPLLKTLNATTCTLLRTLPKLPQFLETLYVSFCDSLQTLPMLPMSLKTLDSRFCHSLETVSFPPTGVDRFTECGTRFLFPYLRTLDEPSLVAIGLNAQINVMKFAYQHISTPNHDHVENYHDKYYSYQAVYVYPGSSVPEWLEYKTKDNHITIDLSSAPPCPLFGFIFCFVLGDYAASTNCHVKRYEVKITISDGEDEVENDSVKIYSKDFCFKDDTDNVHVIYDKRCSAFLNRRAKNQKRFKIKVKMTSLRIDGLSKNKHQLKVHYDQLPQHALKGLGISPMSTLAYESFIQQMVQPDSNMSQFDAIANTEVGPNELPIQHQHKPRIWKVYERRNKKKGEGIATTEREVRF